MALNLSVTHLSLFLALVGFVLSCVVLARCDMLTIFDADSNAEGESTGLFKFQSFVTDGQGGIAKQDCIYYSELGSSIARDNFLASQMTARVFGVLGIVAASIVMLVISGFLFFYYRTSDSIPFKLFAALFAVCTVLQSLTFTFFDSEICSRDDLICKIDTAGILDIVAVICYFLASGTCCWASRSCSGASGNDEDKDNAEDSGNQPEKDEVLEP
mmetsp:Transcript_23376/g.34508  ORF Transcript_23376/g.34508 Transcript_23376/m.34508 type:complete len:215 (-) Transcript_23376:241-885(-)|eukprot:CAMPEP_0194219962 /NCGR_PEP_ID=MMETSP0156-20130528/27224_1 /TAXON_ID=33649 /ORGANISM="Thalassionema nitzschioides, Strain L26-B" /LENGTH=214 /DNA_ID=CAMNT_0038949813 /DNA_START=210 /DNA_END=854 /DNA_ORIENTATION=+